MCLCTQLLLQLTVFIKVMNNLYHKLSICVILGLFSQTVTGFFLAQQHPSKKYTQTNNFVLLLLVLNNDSGTGDGENLLNGKIVRVASVEVPNN